jgi:penicillin-binding protein 2
MTPLQMAVLTAMVANGGYKVTPHLVKDAEVPPPQHVAFDPQALDVVRHALWAVVNEPGGTGYNSARINGLDISGKSGTVQVIAQAQRTEATALPFKYRDHAWFTSFAPVDDPKLVVAVFAEHGGSGSHAAAPIAQALHAKYFKIDLHPPTR